MIKINAERNKISKVDIMRYTAGSDAGCGLQPQTYLSNTQDELHQADPAERDCRNMTT